MGTAQAQQLLDSIFAVATELVRGQRVSLLLREGESTDFVIARAVGLADDVMRRARIRSGEGVAGRVLATKQPILVNGHGPGDVQLDPAARSRYRSDSFMVVPILVDGAARGVLNVADSSDGEPFESSDLERVEMLARHIGACLEQQDQGEAMERLADTDQVTWLPNRRHFERRLESEMNRALRSDTLLAVLMIDVDRFKSVNDRFGHRIGDAVLRAVGTALTHAIRPYDLATRYGGDEFTVLLPEADTEIGSLVAHRIFERLATTALPDVLAAAGETISLSIGIATFPRPATDAAALVESADSAMYRAKAVGGGIRVFEHTQADGPRGRVAPRRTLPHTPYLADPARLARPDLQALIPRDRAEEWNAVVVGHEGPILTVALPEPDAATIDAISQATGLAVYPVYASAADLTATRRRILAG